MRVLLFVTAAWLATPTPAAGQAGSQSTLVLSIHAGLITGHSLWRIGKQPLCVMQPTSFQCSTVYDTLALARDIGSGLTGGMSATLFPTAHVGLQLEVSYLGVPLQNGCDTLYMNPDADQRNLQLCQNIAATQVSASAIGFYGGVTLRAAPRHSLSPYVRLGLGLTSLSNSTIATEGVFITGGQEFGKAIIVDPRPKETFLSYLFGIGITSRLNPGYQFRLEIRDLLASQARADDPANSLGQVPSSTKRYHHLVLAMGLDVVLERRRGRRY